MLIYKITLGKLFLSDNVLKKVIQFGWLGVPTTLSSSLLVKLGIAQMID